MLINEIITKLGLSEKEAAIYNACLENGPLKAKDLSSFSNVNRGTVYDIARSLFKKGLLSTTQKRGITCFVANTPRNYLHDLENNIDRAKSYLPEIEGLLNNSSYRPKLRFFEGKEGLKAIYEDTLTCKDKEILCFASLQQMIDAVGVEFMRDYVKRRIRRHISMRAIDDPAGEMEDKAVNHSMHTDPEMLRQTRIGPRSIFIPGMIEIYDDKVCLIGTKNENFGFVIESKEFTRMMRRFFEYFWLTSIPDKEYYAKKTNL